MALQLVYIFIYSFWKVGKSAKIRIRNVGMNEWIKKENAKI